MAVAADACDGVRSHEPAQRRLHYWRERATQTRFGDSAPDSARLGQVTSEQRDDPWTDPKPLTEGSWSNDDDA